MLEKPETQGFQHRSSWTDPQGAGALGLGRATYRPVDGVADGASCGAHDSQHGVSVRMAHERGDRVMILETEAIATTTCHHMQRVPRVKQRAVCLVDLSVRTVGQPRS